jgi:cell shape-determining protein MreD
MSSFSTSARENSLQSSILYAVSVLCILLYGMPLGFSWLPQVGMAVFLVPLFTAALSSENDLAPVAFILIGLLADVLMEAPLGYWGFLTALFYILSSGQKQVLQNAGFSAHWLSFSIVLLIVYMAGFTISLMRDDLVIQFGGHIFSAILTALAYPIIALPLTFIANALVGQERV